MTVQTIFALFGGLALFIFGMQQMGEGLQKAAGDRMRRILQMLTGNPLMGVLVGTIVTMIIQSSSATTVMVVGFVSAGLMTLPQAIGVIFGANIGTTMTAWIVAAKIDDYAWLFVAAGFIMRFMFKKANIRHIGQIIFSFGVLFVGLNSMGAAMKPLAKLPEFAELLVSIKDVPVLGMLVGALATVVVQSSSAAIGVLQSLSGTASDATGMPLISIYQAIPILFGSNIGTTITAILASIGGSRNAKRAAAAHSVFNIVGSVLFMLILKPYTMLVNFILTQLGQVLIPDVTSPIAGMMTPVAEAMKESIAVSHTIFNMTNTLVWLPFVWLMVKIVKLIVPGEDPIVIKKLAFIDYNVVSRPAIAIDLATKELARMTEIARQMTYDCHQIIQEHTDELEKKIFGNEDTMDYLENEIVRYLSSIFSSASVTDKEASHIAGLMHATNDIERIGDYCSNITDISMQLKAGDIHFSEIAATELNSAFEMIEKIVEASVTALRNTDRIIAKKITEYEPEVDKMEEELRVSHFDRLNRGVCDPKATVLFLELVHTIERISDHCNNIAEVVLRGDEYLVHANNPLIAKMP